MTVIQAVILGLIQGLTEFLPVSSSGHLVLTQHVLGLGTGHLLFDTVVHLGTAAAIFVVFFKDIKELITGLFSHSRQQRHNSITYSSALLIGTLPAVFLGLLFKDFFEARFANTRGVGFMLLVTAGVLFLQLLNAKKTKNIGYLSALLIGLAQAMAIMPGISRSGATIAMALLIGVTREEAGRFSFLLGIIAICGAMVLQIGDISQSSVNWMVMLAGLMVSFISGIGALKLLLAFVRRGQVHWFGFYCIILGLVTIILL